MGDLEARREQKPHERLTRVCDAMLEGGKAHPEYEEGMRLITLVNFDNHGGIGIDGYDDDDDWDAVIDIFLHLKAIVQASGQDLLIVPLKGGPYHG